MKGISAIYLGRIVSKEHFRTFIYSSNEIKKLVESWDDFEKHMGTGIWFATRDDARISKDVLEKPKRFKAKKNELIGQLKEDNLSLNENK